jgi:transposase-like protein
LQGRTEALEDLAVELFARGLSTRDITDVFADGDGRSLLSRATVSQLSERLWAEYQAFASRDLAEHEIVYLFVDGIAERLRPGQAREPVLAAWASPATSWSRYPSPPGRSSRSGSGPATKPRRERSPASYVTVWSPTMSGSCRTPWPASRTDFEACIAHLRFPITHRRALRTTNLLERLFLEERRLLEIIPNAFGARRVLKLMYGAMIRAAERWRGLPVTDFERRQLETVQAELDAEYQASIGCPTAPPQPKASSTHRP